MAIDKRAIYYILALDEGVELWKKGGGWVSHDTIESSPLCPYAQKSATNHRKRYLEKDDNIEVHKVGGVQRHDTKFYRLTQDWNKAQKIIEASREFCEENKLKPLELTPWGTIIRIKEMNYEKEMLISARESINEQIAHKTETGRYLGDSLILATLDHIRKLLDNMLESSEYEEAMRIKREVEEKYKEYRSLKKYDQKKDIEIFLLARAYVKGTIKDVDELDEAQENKNWKAYMKKRSKERAEKYKKLYGKELGDRPHDKEKRI